MGRGFARCFGRAAGRRKRGSTRCCGWRTRAGWPRWTWGAGAATWSITSSCAAPRRAQLRAVAEQDGRGAGGLSRGRLHDSDIEGRDLKGRDPRSDGDGVVTGADVTGTVGRIDVHSHLLPGIDDGCKTVEESVEC